MRGKPDRSALVASRLLLGLCLISTCETRFVSKDTLLCFVKKQGGRSILLLQVLRERISSLPDQSFLIAHMAFGCLLCWTRIPDLGNAYVLEHFM